MGVAVHQKPRVLLLPDVPGWAFDIAAQAYVRVLKQQFDFRILYTQDQPEFREEDYDLIHVFYEQEQYYRRYVSGKARLLKQVESHEWAHQGQTPESLYEHHLRDADAVLVPSLKLAAQLTHLPVPLFVYPAGVDTRWFTRYHSRTGPLVVGWAGNPNLHRELKNLPMLQAAAGEEFALEIADGKLPYRKMPNFYRQIDVICCCSLDEGNPRTLIEGMACGAFPVSFDVGIAPQLIEHGVNGLLIRERSADALRAALRWCNDHLDQVRAAAFLNRQRIQAQRDFASTARRMAEVYHWLLDPSQPQP